MLDTEMYRTFNCGIGMVICVNPDQAQRALQLLSEASVEASIIGEVTTRKANEEAVVLT